MMGHALMLLRDADTPGAQQHDMPDKHDQNEVHMAVQRPLTAPDERPHTTIDCTHKDAGSLLKQPHEQVAKLPSNSGEAMRAGCQMDVVELGHDIIGSA